MKKKKSYRPNKYPQRVLIFCFVLGSFLLLYVLYGLYQGQLYIPGKRTDGMILKGFSMWVMAGALIFAASFLLSFFIDHFDARDNEWKYEKFRKWTGKIGWTLFSIAIIWQFYSIISKYL